MLGVLPPADVPPTEILLICGVEEHEKTFVATDFSRLEAQRVVGPARIAGGDEASLGHGVLLKRAVLYAPLATHRFPAVHALCQIAGVNRLAILPDLDVLELRL